MCPRERAFSFDGAHLAGTDEPLSRATVRVCVRVLIVREACQAGLKAAVARSDRLQRAGRRPETGQSDAERQQGAE